MKRLLVLLSFLPLLVAAQFPQEAVSCKYGTHEDRACNTGTLLKFIEKFGTEGLEIAGTAYDTNDDQTVNTADLITWISGWGNEINFNLEQIYITDVFSGSLLGTYADSLYLGSDYVRDMYGNVLPSIPIRVVYTLADESCTQDLTGCFPEWESFRIESMLGAQLLNFEIEFIKP